MEITLRHIGNTIIEMIVINLDTTIITDVTNVKGLVGQRLIDNLREVADELESHNEKYNKIF